MTPDSENSTPKTCFLIEDNLKDQEFFKAAVGRLSFPVTCEVFDDVYDLIKSHKKSAVIPDIIFIGHNMPYQKGMLCIEVLSEFPEFADVPLVIHTDMEESAVKKAFGENKAKYLMKSSSVDTLSSCVETFIHDSYRDAKEKGGINDFTPEGRL